MNRPHQSKHAGRLRRLVDIGGGNIGSHLIAHLARLREVGELLLIDSGTYEAKDIRSQEINPGDVGRFKALVQAQRASQINPGLRITAISERVENVPWGLLNADVILTGLDSKASRCAVNLIAWRLGIPWIDAAVEADGLLARISVFRPGPNRSCMECAWDERDYATLDQRHLCQPEAEAPATNATSSLGALAAALQAIECGKVLDGDWEHVAVDRQLLVDARSGALQVTTFSRSRRCRFDHVTWDLTRLVRIPVAAPLEAALALGRKKFGTKARISVALEGKTFATKLTCPYCLQATPLFCVAQRAPQQDGWCGKCKCPKVASGLDVIERLDDTLPQAIRERPLNALGIQAGDFLQVSAGRKKLLVAVEDAAPTSKGSKRHE